MRRANSHSPSPLSGLSTIRQWYETSAEHWLQQVSGNGNVNFYIKRIMDVILAAMLLILLLPLLLLIALTIKLGSPGPVLFVQQRVGARRRSGRDGTKWEIQNFFIYKFRTMTHNADQSLHQAYIKAFVEGDEGVSEAQEGDFKLANDPRVTPVGQVLRKTSLDELPQLLNVLKGEMSLVGPRPVPTYEVAEYEAWHHERLAALPGITGLWQVKGRGRVAFAELIRMDIDYVRNQSLWLDLQLLILTVPAVLTRRGAK